MYEDDDVKPKETLKDAYWEPVGIPLGHNADMACRLQGKIARDEWK